MTGSEYQNLAMRTSTFLNANSEQDVTNMAHHAVFGLNSEAGEIAGMFQKIYQGHEISADHLIKEMGDALWFLAELTEFLGTNLDEVMKINIEKLKARYPDGFEPEKSLNRAEGDI